MSTRRSISRGSFVGSQLLERRRLLSAAIGGRSAFISPSTQTELIIHDSTIAARSDRSISTIDSPVRLNLRGPEGDVLQVLGTNGIDEIILDVAEGSVFVTVNGQLDTFPDAGISDIEIDGFDGADLISIESNGTHHTTVRGGDGLDDIRLSPTAGDLDRIGAPVDIDGQGDGASLSLHDLNNNFTDPYTINASAISRAFFGSANFTNLTGLQLFCQAVASQINVQSTPACPTGIFGSGGDDICNLAPDSLNLEALGGAFSFNGEADDDEIHLFDTSNTFDDAWTMLGDSISRPFVDPIQCVAETIVVNMGTGHNAFELSNFAQPFLSVDGWEGDDRMVVNGLAADSTVLFLGYNGNDSMDVEESSSGSAVNFLGEANADTMRIGFQTGDLGNVAGTTNFDGGLGSDEVSLFDDLNSGASSYGITSTTVTRSEGFGGLTYASLNKVFLSAQQGDNDFAVQNSSPGTLIEINGNNGDDILNLAQSSGRLMDISASVSFNGGIGTDDVNFFDHQRENGATYSLSDTELTGDGFPPMTFSQIELAQLFAGPIDDLIHVNNDSSLTQKVHAGSGADIIDVTQTVTPAQIDGGPGLDQFIIGGVFNEGDNTASAIAISNTGDADQLSAVSIGAGSTLAITEDHTLTSTSEEIIGTLSFGHRSSYIAVAAPFAMTLDVARNLILAGYSGGAWNGMGGSFSSHASASTTIGDGIGYARASDLELTTFDDVELNPDDMIFTQTLYGDTNLDYTVDFNDLLKVAQRYNTIGNYWFDGDSTYDQIVDFNDLLRVAQNYNHNAFARSRRVVTMIDSLT